MSTDLTLLAEDPDLAPLWAALRERLCSGAAPTAIAAVRVRGLSPAAVAALRAWLDTTTRRRRGRSSVTVTADAATVPVRELLDVLGITPQDLPTFVERATGRPIVNRAQARQAASAARGELWEYATYRLPQLPGLISRMRTAGIGNGEAETRRLIDALAAAMASLPAIPPVSLPKLAHDTAGDPHYFDLGTLNGARLTAAVAELLDQPEPTRPDHVRALLTQAGVHADRLWSAVLLHQVHTIGDGPIDQRLRDAATPVALTLLDLTTQPPTFAPQTLTVVENPSVIEAAVTAGSMHAFACTGGQLRAVDHTLLQLAADQGVHLRYAGDIDSHGVHIAEYVAATYGAEIIAMDSQTVRDTTDQPSAVQFGPLQTLGDPQLADAIDMAGGRKVFQEHDAVLNRLLT